MVARTSEEAIELFTPRMAQEKWEAIGPFVRAVVRHAFDPSPSPAAAANRMGVVTALVSWAVDHGLPLDREQIFHPATVNRYVQTMEGFTEATRSCRRSTLTTVSRRVTHAAPWQPRRERIAYRTTTVPYTDDQILRLIDCAEQQATPTRVRVLTAVVALGLGAGLTAKEMTEVTGSDVSGRRSHVVIAVPGAHRRLVPLLDRYAPTVRELACTAGPGRLIVDSPPRPSYVPEVIARCDIPEALQQVSAVRLRLTWEVLMLRSVPLPVFLRLSGHGVGIRVRPMAEFLDAAPRTWTTHEIGVIAQAAPW